MRSRRFAFLAVLLCTSAAARAFAAASLTPLGDLPGGLFESRAAGVSGDGSVVVGSSPSASAFPFSAEAFRWTSGGGMVGLGDLPGGFFQSSAIGVSADGSVVVGYGASASGQEAFRWTSSGGMVGLGTLPGAGNSWAYGVSADGSVVVGSSLLSTGFEAFRWTSGGGIVGLGNLPGGLFHSGANAASDDGSVVVGNSYSASGQEAFRWTSGGGMVGLGDLPGGSFDSWAFDVNGDGSVVVGYGTSASGHEAFRWTSGGGMVGLGDLPGGSFLSSAYGLSADGSVIVGVGSSASGEEAFRWTSDGGMERLWDVLLSQGIDPAATGWTEFTVASGISADGNTIVGTGTRNGNTEAFVAVIPTIVPEPATGALALLGVSSLLLLRRRSLGRPNKFLWAPGGFRAGRQLIRSSAFSLLAILLCTSAAARASAAASLTPLGYLPGDLTSTANSVSGDGSVVVGTSGGYGGQAFRWTAAGGMVGLGRLPGDFYSYARGVSGDGSAVVGGSDYAFDDYYRIQASRWTAVGGMQGLGHLPGGGFVGVAVGVSANGSVIVGTSDSASGDQAFRWTATGGMQGLGDLPGGGFQSEANGVSGDGSVIVGYGTSAAGSQAFRWTSAGGMVGLGFLPGDLYSGAFGVSADGSIVVGTSSSVSGAQVFRWTSADGMVGLGNLPGGFLPWGFSSDGSVVVGYETGNDISPRYTALYWTPDGGMRDLWDLLLSQGVDPAADGWSRLEFAKAISADGNTIVGDGIRNGHSEAFVAVIPTIVPEPAAGALALLGVSSILLLRRRCVWRPNKLKALRCQALAGALTLIAAAPAVAIDTEPLNNSQLTADSLPQLLPGTAISNLAGLGGAGGDVDFFQTPLAEGEVLFGMVTPLAGLSNPFQSPETIASVFDDSGARTFSAYDGAGELPNDGSGFGDTYGSIFRFAAPTTADYRIGVSGCCDFEFDGDAGGRNEESGAYVLTAGRVNPAMPGGDFTDTDPANQTAAGADLISLEPGAARVAVAELTAGDVDFFRLDLKAGDILSVLTAPLADLPASFALPWTRLGLFDSSGTNLLVANEFAGGWVGIVVGYPDGTFAESPDLPSDSPYSEFSFGLGAALRASIPADGDYYLAVTGIFDDGFAGAHEETGAYALLVGVAAVPEPGSAMLAASAMVACGLGRFVKRNRRVQ